MLSVLGLSLLSCDHRDSVADVRNESVHNKVKLSGMFGVKSLEGGLLDTNSNEPKPPKADLIIFEVKIARASQRCLTGWGFCDFKWFPMLKNSMNTSNSFNSVLVEAKKEKGDYVFYLYVTNPVSDINSSDLNLVVDEDLVVEEQNGLPKSFTLRAGTYSYDASIGEYGGYRIILQ